MWLKSFPGGPWLRLVKLTVFLCFQVANAASKGAAAVLVYPDPQEYKYNNDTELFGHVSSNPPFSLCAGLGRTPVCVKHTPF